MSKGMNLDQLRETLDTDAQKRCMAQEKTIRELNEKLKAEKVYSDKVIRALQNRCRALTRGTMCMFCGMKQDCKASK